MVMWCWHGVDISSRWSSVRTQEGEDSNNDIEGDIDDIEAFFQRKEAEDQAQAI